MITLIFKTNLLQSLLAFLTPTIIYALVGTLILNPYYRLFNISYEESASIPLRFRNWSATDSFFSLIAYISAVVSE